MVADSSLDPRLDMVWRESMKAWIPAGQIDGLFERTSMPAKPEKASDLKSAPVVKARKSPKAPLAQRSSWPGARRRSFILVALIFPFAWDQALGAAGPFLTTQFGHALMGRILPYAALVPLAALTIFGLKRLMNLGMTRLWFLAAFVPVLNVWLGYRCFACPAGYGYQKKLDGPGVLLAALYCLLVVSIGGILASIVALHFGAIENPELKDQLRGLIRAALSPLLRW
jgi:hypothetical protein